MVRIGKKSYAWQSVIFKIGGFSTELIKKISFGEKITDELVYGANRAGIPIDVTPGKYEPDMLVIGFLMKGFYGAGTQAPGIAQKLCAAAGTTSIGDIECDVYLQLVEELVGVVTFNFPRVRIVAPKVDLAEGTSASEIEVSCRVIDPIQVNGTQLASVQRSLTTDPGF